MGLNNKVILDIVKVSLDEIIIGIKFAELLR